MLVELLKVFTGDGLRLEGTLDTRRADAPFESRALAILIHGTGGSFYSGSLFDGLAAPLKGLGLHLLRINTRGHDLVSTASTPEGPKRQGAAYERVEQATLDLHAWLEFAAQRGYERVIVIGHSLGALKGVYVLAKSPAEIVSGLVAISPPHLSCAKFLASLRAAEFRQNLDQAKHLVSQGLPETLVDVKFPIPVLATAAGYIEKYGENEKYNLLPWIGKLQLPALFVFGQEEVDKHVAFQHLPELIAGAGLPLQPLVVQTLPGADHFYVGKIKELAECLGNWYRLLFE